MSDVFSFSVIPPLNRQNFPILVPGLVTATSPHYTWRKPRGTMFTAFFMHGAGNNGGVGFTRTAGSPGGGGGGGGGGAIVKAIFSNDMLPDELSVYMAGGLGGRCYITLPGITAIAAINTYLITGAADAGVGGNGTASAAGALGAASTVMTVTSAILSNLSISLSGSSGSPGVAGGVHTGAAGVSKTIDNIVTGAAGGGGCTTTNFAGGAITGAGAYPGIIAGTAAGGNGLDGYSFTSPRGILPIGNTGGSGGGSNNSGAGGKGGNGAPGSGGGGGGAGATGGAGGLGGPSYGFSVSW